MIAAHDDAISVGPLRDYFEASKVASLMDIGFSVNGVLFGTFSCEQLGEQLPGHSVSCNRCAGFLRGRA